LNILGRAVRIAVLASAAAVLLSMSACAHRDLTAPCSAQTGWGNAFAAEEPGCGLMRTVN
jgi:hypothetical protein